MLGLGVLWVDDYRPAIALAVFAEQLLYKLGIGDDMLAVAVVTIDKHYEMSGGEGELSALMVACGGSHTTYGIAIDW